MKRAPMPLAAIALCALLAQGLAPDQPESEGVSPIEVVPRVELRQAYSKLPGGASVDDSVVETDILFLRRLLLRYQFPARLLATPAGQVSGIGDIQVGLIGVLESTPRFMMALLAGAQLDTATQPALGTGKQQVVLGFGAAGKPARWLLVYGVGQQAFSVAGASSRPDQNQFAADTAAILLGRQFNWLKLDLLTTVDFPGGAVGRLYGTVEAGSLVIGRVGLFVRGGTQLAGPRLVDWNLAAGIRYLFRLETARAAPSSPG